MCVCVQVLDEDELEDEDEDEDLIISGNNLSWYQDFWQEHWTWQYFVMGAATVCVWAIALHELGIVGGESVLLEMLEMISLQNEQLKDFDEQFDDTPTNQNQNKNEKDAKK